MPSEKQPPLKGWQQAVSGATAGVLSRFVIAPLDVIKIRYQLQSKRQPLLSHQNATIEPPKYQSLAQACRCIVREEGWRALWKGNLSAELLYLGYGASQFFTYSQLRQRLQVHTHLPASMVDMLSGATAGMVATLLTYPLDLLRTRFAAQGEPKIYTTLKQATLTIYRDEGALGLYRGLRPSLLQIAPAMAITFSAYEALSRIWRRWNWAPAWQDVVCGGAAGTLSKVCVMPLDVVRKNLQVQGPTRTRYAVHAIPKFANSILGTAVQIVRAEGVRALWKGVVPSVLKAAPASAVTFYVYAKCQRYFGGISRLAA